MTRKRTPSNGFTIIELMVALVIIGVLASLAIPGFLRTKERALDKEAQIGLNFIAAGEKIYRVKTDRYYPPSGSANKSAIEDALQLDLSSSAWEYTIEAVSANFNATAARKNEPPGWSRRWLINASGVLSCVPCATCAPNVCPP